MARIETYIPDYVITPNDWVIGTDGDNFNKTKNYPVIAMLDYLGTNFNLQSADLVYNYSVDDENTLLDGQFTSNNRLDTVPFFADVTTLYISKTTVFGKLIDDYIQTVSDETYSFMIYDFGDYNNFGFYQIVSAVSLDSDTFTLVVTFKSGSGSLQDGLTHGLKVYPSTSSAWGSITGTLSNQTDLQSALNLKADDNNVVKLTGNQLNIDGTKQFLSSLYINSNDTSYSSLFLKLATDNLTQNSAVSGYGGMYFNNDGTFRLQKAGSGTNLGFNFSAITGTAKDLVFTDSDITWNGISLLSSGSAWGSITGTLSNQTDLQNALNGKAGLTANNLFSGINTFDNPNQTIFKNNDAVQINLTQASSGNSIIIGAGSNANFFASSGMGFSFKVNGETESALSITSAKVPTFSGLSGTGNRMVVAGSTGTLSTQSIPVISNTAYDATSWNNNLDGASKNAIRDKIESLTSFNIVSTFKKSIPAGTGVGSQGGVSNSSLSDTSKPTNIRIVFEGQGADISLLEFDIEAGISGTPSVFTVPNTLPSSTATQIVTAEVQWYFTGTICFVNGTIKSENGIVSFFKEFTGVTGTAYSIIVRNPTASGGTIRQEYYNTWQN